MAWLFVWAAGFLPSPGLAEPANWPAGYVVVEPSPNERYGVLVPGRELLGLDETDAVNSLVDIKAGTILGKLRGFEYIVGLNRRDLRAVWNKESNYCVLEDQFRFGFGSLALIDVHGGKMTQTDIGTRITKSLDGAIARQSKNKGDAGNASGFYRFTPEGTLKVRVLSSTNPKRFEDQKTYCALFEGTLHLKSKTWAREEVRAISVDTLDALESEYESSRGEQVPTGSKEEEAALDEELNRVYKAVRAVVPANSFAGIKRDQIEWLKVRDASSSPGEKCKRILLRIQGLREILWSE